MSWLSVVLEVLKAIWDAVSRKSERMSAKRVEEQKQEVKHAVESHDPSEITLEADRLRRSR
jgi:hypothetical protein